MQWWKGSNTSSHCFDAVLRPIDCGSATLCILIGQSPEELLEVARRDTRSVSSQLSCKVEPTAGVVAAPVVRNGSTAHNRKMLQHTSVALSDTALVDMCIHTVVPFCVAVLQSTQLSDEMPITNGCGIFDRLLRWALTLQPMPGKADVDPAQLKTAVRNQELSQQQQSLSIAINETTVSDQLSIELYLSSCIFRFESTLGPARVTASNSNNATCASRRATSL